MAGAPLGNRNGAKGAKWRQALDAALKRYEKKGECDRGQALLKIAFKVVEGALAGDKDCWAEIGNRLDGKPSQSLDVKGTAFDGLVAYLRAINEQADAGPQSSRPTDAVQDEPTDVRH